MRSVTMVNLRAVAKKIAPEIAEIRRDIHAHPESGFQEVRTSSLVAERLRDLGLEVRRGVAKTGVVGLLRGNGRGKTVALRADMDALKIQEQNRIPHASRVKERMHACGHDGHTATLLGVAQMLSGLRGEFRGNVKFIFQPAEEGGGGGRIMCEEGVLANPRVDAVFALHSWPFTEVGSIAIRYGAMMAAADTFKVVIKGEGTHGAYPHRGVDPVVVSAKVIENLQFIISRERNPVEPAVITVGIIHGGTARNVIPERVVMEGTVRTLAPELRPEIKQAMRRVIGTTAKAFRAGYSFRYMDGYPPTINHDEMVDLVCEVGEKVLGKGSVHLLGEASMGGEDFSYYLQRVPGAMFRLGVGKPGETKPVPLHNPRFDFNDEAIEPGMSVLAAATLRYLSGEK
jgi:amidohydrolase